MSNPFIIWTLQSTGGTNLTAKLVELAGLKSAPHEPFNPDRCYGHITQAWRETQDRAALEQAVAEVAARGEVIKHCVETVPWEVTEALIEASHAAAYRHLFLHRQRADERLLSLHFAKETNIWGPDMKKMKTLTGAPELVGNVGAPREEIGPVPVEKLLAHERFCLERLEKAWRRLQALGAQPVAVSYEEIYRAPSPQAAEAALARVLTGLGIAIAAEVLPAWTQSIVGQGDQGTRNKYRDMPGAADLIARAARLPGFLKPSYELTWRALTADHPWILHASVDVLPAAVREEEEFEIGGVVVLSQQAPVDAQLFLRLGDGTRQPLEWLIASPRMAKAYPQARNGAKARWRGFWRLEQEQPRVAVNLEADGQSSFEVMEIEAMQQAPAALAFDSLVIVTYGRTGSTLLMGLLNTIPGACIRGENLDFCRGLYQSYQSLLGAKKYGGISVTNPFYGSNELSLQSFIQDARTMLRRQLLNGLCDIRLWGFKEIRWLSPDKFREQDFKGYLDFMAKLMPRPGFVFLTRDPNQVAHSAWWKNMPKKKVEDFVSTFERFGREWSDERQDAFWIDYAEITSITPRLRALFQWLGAPLDESRVETVLHTEHSDNNNPEHVPKNMTI